MQVDDQEETTDKPHFDETIARSYLGKHLLIDLTITDHEGHLVEQRQIHEWIARINEREGIVMRLNNSNEEYALPPDLRRLQTAPPGGYRLRSGEMVVNPDFTATWTVKQPPPEKKR
jgi:hypothetical protein